MQFMFHSGRASLHQKVLICCYCWRLFYIFLTNLFVSTSQSKIFPLLQQIPAKHGYYFFGSFLLSDSYSSCMKTIFSLSQSERESLCLRARDSALRFDEEMFNRSFLSSCSELFTQLLSGAPRWHSEPVIALPPVLKYDSDTDASTETHSWHMGYRYNIQRSISTSEISGAVCFFAAQGVWIISVSRVSNSYI